MPIEMLLKKTTIPAMYILDMMYKAVHGYVLRFLGVGETA
jgi:hypothetical protein